VSGSIHSTFDGRVQQMILLIAGVNLEYIELSLRVEIFNFDAFSKEIDGY